MPTNVDPTMPNPTGQPSGLPSAGPAPGAAPAPGPNFARPSEAGLPSRVSPATAVEQEADQQKRFRAQRMAELQKLADAATISPDDRRTLDLMLQQKQREEDDEADRLRAIERAKAEDERRTKEEQDAKDAAAKAEQQAKAAAAKAEQDAKAEQERQAAEAAAKAEQDAAAKAKAEAEAEQKATTKRK